MSATVIFPLAQWLEGTNQNSTPANDNSLRIQALSAPAKGYADAAPSTPANYDQWIVGSSWGGFTGGNIVIWLDGSWKEFETYDGMFKAIGIVPSFKFSGTWHTLALAGS